MHTPIKPTFVVVLLAAIAILSGFYYLRTQRPTPAVSAPSGGPGGPRPVDIYAGQLWDLDPAEPGAAEMAVQKQDVPGGEFYALTIKQGVKEPQAVRFRIVTPTNIVKGEDLRLEFSARSAESLPFTANFEQSDEPHKTSLSRKIETSRRWKPYSITFKAADDYLPEKTRTAFYCGSKPGMIEFASLRLYRTPK